MPTAQRWRRVEELYHAAQACDASRRTAYLAEACAGDEKLRREVESLLAQPASADGFFDRLGAAVAGQVVDEIATVGVIGRRIGPYQVQACIGAGGMGEVYRARDTRLGRDVAIKILPREFTSDP